MYPWKKRRGFLPLDNNQMLTFSSICDDFIKSEGFEKKECADDSEARLYAHKMEDGNDSYPVVFFKSDTTGEKSFEEFYVPGEIINMSRFNSLGIIEVSSRPSMSKVDDFLNRLNTLFTSDFTKEDVVRAIHDYLPNFEHEEKGKNLDQKM